MTAGESTAADTGTLLAFLAATTEARAVVEIGTGSGASGLHLLRGMVPGGTLTTIDVDPELQRTARRSFLDAGHSPGRLRLINGLALEVLPRLTDGGYDLVVVHAHDGDAGAYLAEAVRLLRPGGVVVLADAEDPDLRETVRAAEEGEQLVSAVLPLAGGLLVATRR
ncbi:O-methyltransferase [Pseudonocardia halophobica]|uniref:O-methyltransferase n=1 Tax=Pseudonocardia halophobica TaxID=29401 RepID=UPI003D8E849E